MRWIKHWTRSAFRARSTTNAKRRLSSVTTSLNPLSTLLVRTRTTPAAAKSTKLSAARRLSFVSPPGKRQPGWRHRRHPGHLSLGRSVRSHHTTHAAICRRTRRMTRPEGLSRHDRLMTTETTEDSMAKALKNGRLRTNMGYQRPIVASASPPPAPQVRPPARPPVIAVDDYLMKQKLEDVPKGSTKPIQQVRFF